MTVAEPLDVLRSLLDPVRLAVVGAASSGDVSVTGLAERLGIPPKAVARAVGDLRGVGLLDEGGALDQDALRAIAQSLPSPGGPTGQPVAGPWTSDEAAILGRFFDGDRLVEIPSSHAKRRLVLEKIALGFEPGRRYRERDLNFMIQLIHPDYAAIRRYMVDEGLLDRADGAYWRIGGRIDVAADGGGPDVAGTADRTVLPTSLTGVELRAYDRSMVTALADVANDRRIPAYMGDEFPYPYTVEDAETWVSMASSGSPPTQYAIFVGGGLAGGAGGFPRSGEETGTVEIGWWLHPDHWGRGITSACASVIVDEFFTHHGAMRCVAPVMGPNVASAHVAENAGLTLEGVERSAYLKRGVRHDKRVFGITRSDWLGGRSDRRGTGR